VIYSVVVPIYNDGELAADFCRELKLAFAERLADRIDTDLEVVFVDDGSRNDSVEVLKRLPADYPFVKVIALSRNFGQHIAISCGYRHTRGRFVAYLNVDQEDPPNQILPLADALEKNGWDIVGGLYSKRDVPFLARVTSYLFNIFLNYLTGYDQPTNASTLRVMTRRFIDAYNGLVEKSRYIPGLEMWLGFKYGRLPVTHQKRRRGKSSYNFSRRLRMAVESIISFSDFPLRFAVKLGFVVTALGALLVSALIIDKLFFRELLPGYVSTITAVVLLGGIQVMVTGVASLYIGRILAEVQGRPLYVIREKVGDLACEQASAPRLVAGGGEA
jgi:dolichol-phosphate mannosyltransferase